MPRAPTLRVRALADLARQLRFGSELAAARQLERTEKLLLELLAQHAEGTQSPALPESWVVFRITGLRTDDEREGPDKPTSERGQPASIVMDALLSDLAALISRLSSASRQTAKTLPGRWLSVDDLRARWGVSAKTLERAQRQGLASRRVSLARGRERSVFSMEMVRAFERAFGAPGQRRRFTSRIASSERAAIIRRAIAYHARLGWSLHRCAARLAMRHGRTRQGIARVLREHDRRSTTPIFHERGPVRAAEARLIDQRVRSGEAIAQIATSVGRSPASAYRLAHAARARWLRQLQLQASTSPMFARPDAGEVFLGTREVGSGLGQSGTMSLRVFADLARSHAPPDVERELALASACAFLVWRAQGAIARLLPGSTRLAHHIDLIETDLRWASRLKAELVRDHLPGAVRSAQSRLDTPLESLETSKAAAIARCVLDATIEAIDAFDPFKGGRLAAPITVWVSRAIARWVQGEREAPARAATRAQPRAQPRARPLHEIEIDDWTRRVHPWQTVLEPPPELAQSLKKLSERDRLVLERRFGYDGSPPASGVQVARELGTSVSVIRAIERRAVASIRS